MAEEAAAGIAPAAAAAVNIAPVAVAVNIAPVVAAGIAPAAVD
jgi:hypothetical protein